MPRRKMRLPFCRSLNRAVRAQANGGELFGARCQLCDAHSCCHHESGENMAAPCPVEEVSRWWLAAAMQVSSSVRYGERKKAQAHRPATLRDGISTRDTGSRKIESRCWIAHSVTAGRTKLSRHGVARIGSPDELLAHRDSEVFPFHTAQRFIAPEHLISAFQTESGADSAAPERMSQHLRPVA